MAVATATLSAPVVSAGVTTAGLTAVGATASTVSSVAIGTCAVVGVGAIAIVAAPMFLAMGFWAALSAPVSGRDVEDYNSDHANLDQGSHDFLSASDFDASVDFVS